MIQYIKLAGVALLPAALSVILYLLKKKTPYKKLPYAVRQIIAGIAFGGIAVLGTEYGINIGDATVNARDAAPLCAGLFFGGPAGIIAGFIGGIERWFAAGWGAGAYSKTACSISTILAGFYAAYLRKNVFDGKRPSWGLAFATGVVMEVVHMIILFLTHLSDAERAYDIVKVCTGPMVLANAFALMVTSLVLGGISKEINKGVTRLRTISQNAQTYLLATVIICYLATTVFVFTLNTGTSKYETESLMRIYIDDVIMDIEDTSDANLLGITRSIAERITDGNRSNLDELARQYDVTEINVVSPDGIITDSTNSLFIGFDMGSGEQAAEFLVLNNGTREYVQSYRPITFNPDDENLSRKYAGVSLPDGGFVQVGYGIEDFQSDLTEIISGLTRNRHIGENGFLLIADGDLNILSDYSSHDAGSLLGTDMESLSGAVSGEMYTATIYGKECYWMYDTAEGFYVAAVMPRDEVFASRDGETYINSFMEVLVFALVFMMTFALIKKLVVENIKKINKGLGKICAGELDTPIEVRSSAEFSELSDGINETVGTLREYVDREAKRIDRELEFARKIQMSSLPSAFPAFPGRTDFDIYAFTEPAKKVGGDFYDFYLLDKSKLAIVMADVSGKGIPAAMFMMKTKTVLKSLAETGLEVNEVMTEANERLCAENDAEMFVTVWMGVLDLETGRMTFANAGHNPPIICEKSGECRYLKTRPGLALAGMDGIRYKLQEYTLKPGDSLFLYTDGVTEASNSAFELYGEERLLAFAREHADRPAEEYCGSLKADLERHTAGAEQYDDITMLMLKFEGAKTVAMKERIFPADDSKLAEAMDFVREELEAADCSMRAMIQVETAVEELFVNVAHYAYPDMSGTVKIGVAVSDGKAFFRFNDSGIPFDPLNREDPDVSASAEDRSIGGLGIFMVKKTMENLRYEYKDGQNVLTFEKSW